MKKLLSLMLAAALTLSLACPAFAADSGSVRVEDIDAKPGSEIKVPVYLDENPGVAYLKLKISYDKGLTCTNIENNTGIFDVEGASFTPGDISKNPFYLVWNASNSTELVKDTGLLATLTFTVSKEAAIGETFKIEVAVAEARDKDYGDVPFIGSTSDVTIQGNAWDSSIKLEDQSFTYDGTEKNLRVTGNLPEGAEVTYSDPRTDAGTYDVTATITCPGYATKTLTAKMTINPVDLTVTGMTAQNKEYDGTTNAVITGGQLNGVIADDDVDATFPTSGVFASQNVGTGISVTFDALELKGTDKANYTLTQPAALKADITAKTIGVAAQPAQKFEGQADPELKYNVNGTLVNGDAFSGALSREAGEEPGEYAITQGTLTLGSNYKIDFTGAKLTILEVNVTRIEVTKNPTKLTYIEGEKFDTAGMVITAYFADGTNSTISNENLIIEPKVLSLGTEKVTISYGGQSAEVTVTVNPRTLDSIKVEGTPAKNVVRGEDAPDMTGLTVTAIYNNGTTANVTDNDNVTATVQGEKIIVSYTEGDVTKTAEAAGYVVIPSDATVESVSVDAAKAKTSYRVGDTFSTEGLVVKAKFSNSAEVEVTGYEVSNPDMSKAGKQTITVTYEGKTATYEITVSATSGGGTSGGGSSGGSSSGGSSGGSSSGGSSGGSGSSSGSSSGGSGSSGGTVVGPDEPEVKTPFTDINGHWAEEVIGKIYSKGIMSGVSATEFAPNTTLTRGMVVTILYRLEGEPEVTAQNQFTDVAEDQYYFKATVWAAENGIVKGMGEGIFAPNAQITREQLAAIMCRYAESKGVDVSKKANLTAYTDAGQVSAWAVESMEWAVANNIISGKGAGILDAQGTATRAECAQIIYNFIGE